MRTAMGRGTLIVAVFMMVGVTASFAGSKLRVTDSQGGCFHDADASYSLRKTQQGYGRGDESVTHSAIDHLRSLLLNARDGRDTLLEDLGVIQG